MVSQFREWFKFNECWKLYECQENGKITKLSHPKTSIWSPCSCNYPGPGSNCPLDSRLKIDKSLDEPKLRPWYVHWWSCTTMQQWMKIWSSLLMQKWLRFGIFHCQKIYWWENFMNCSEIQSTMQNYWNMFTKRNRSIKKIPEFRWCSWLKLTNLKVSSFVEWTRISV